MSFRRESGGSDLLLPLFQGLRGCLVPEFFGGEHTNINDSYIYPPLASSFGSQQAEYLPTWVNYTGNKVYAHAWNYTINIANVTGQPNGYNPIDIGGTGLVYYPTSLPIGGRFDLLIWNPNQQTGTYPVSNYKMYLNGPTKYGAQVPSSQQMSLLDLSNTPYQVAWSENFIVMPQMNRKIRLMKDTGCKAIKFDEENVLYTTLKASTNFVDPDSSTLSWVSGNIIVLVLNYLYTYQYQVQDADMAKITPGGNTEVKGQNTTTSLPITGDPKNPPNGF